MPAVAIDLTGRKFGRLTVIERAPNYGKSSVWFCRCDCGEEKIARSGHLRSGATTSCGCYRREVTGERTAKANLKHGHAAHVAGGATSEYMTWQAAKGRCFNPKDKDYKNYGGRGITMCAEWRDNFAAFYVHVGPKPAGLTLDRYPNNDGNYEPNNVRWATPKEQANNKRPRR